MTKSCFNCANKEEIYDNGEEKVVVCEINRYIENIYPREAEATASRCIAYKEESLTNEEWFDGLSTEEKAKVLRRKTHGNDEENERIEQGWVNWLKAKHEDNPPDIPSVPSWDNWLEGERTKCEYCDGSGAECNLAGKFECPKTPKTEQEYIQTCTTEQLAKFLACVEAREDVEYDENTKAFEEWLKQPHTTEE